MPELLLRSDTHLLILRFSEGDLEGPPRPEVFFGSFALKEADTVSSLHPLVVRAHAALRPRPAALRAHALVLFLPVTIARADVAITFRAIDQYQQPISGVAIQVIPQGNYMITDINGEATGMLEADELVTIRADQYGRFSVEDTNVPIDSTWTTYVVRMPKQVDGGYAITTEQDLLELEEGKFSTVPHGGDSVTYKTLEESGTVNVYFDPGNGAFTEAQKDVVASAIGMARPGVDVSQSLGGLLEAAGGNGRSTMYVEVFTRHNSSSPIRGLNIRKGSSFTNGELTEVLPNGRAYVQLGTVTIPASSLSLPDMSGYGKELWQANAWGNVAYTPSCFRLSPDNPTSRDVRHVNLIYDDRQSLRQIDDMPGARTHTMLEWDLGLTTDVHNLPTPR